MKKISARQLYFFLACIAPVGKLIIMPARLAHHCGNDLLLPTAMHFIMQAFVIFFVLLLAKRGLSLHSLLVNTFGKIVAKVLILLLTAFLFYAAFLPLLEQKVFVQGTFYDTIPSVIAFAPFYLVCIYICSKPLLSYGRTWDILGPLAIIGFVGVLTLSVTGADYGAVLPIGSSGIKGILRGTAYTFSWFFDSAILLMFLGRLEYRKGMAWKGAAFYLLGGLGVLFFLATFYGIFQETAINQLFAFSKTSKYFSGITVLGRVDFIFIYALAFVMIFYCSLPLQAGIEGILQAFGKKRYLPTLLAIGVNLLLIALTMLFDYKFGDVMHAISERWFWLFPIFTIAVPLLCLALRRKQRNEST